MGSLIDSLVEQLGLTPSDILIVIMVACVSVYITVQESRHREEINKQIEKLEKRMDSRFSSVSNRHAEAINKVWLAIDKLRESIGKVKDLYHQIDKLTSNIAIAIQRVTGLKLIKQSADGKGDHALNRDVE